MDANIRTTDSRGTTLQPTAVDELATALQGDLLTSASPDYDSARTIWNAMIDRRPALIARCRTANDVANAARFARRQDLQVAVRGGGHNIAGSAMVDDGIVIDLSAMKTVRVDQEQRTARVEAGATLADVDRATQEFGLATPLGINSTTGVAGLTLGGGFGWLTRAFGYTVDNLLAAEIVTADGELLRASERSHPDLFWAIRGGGGNFGIVTAFEFRLHPVGPEVLAGLVVHPFENAGALLRGYREVAAQAPDELSAWVVLRKAPPLPFLPPEVHGQEIVVFAACYAGDLQSGERAMAPLRALGTPIADVIAPTPYTGWQTAFDPLLTPGARNYWKTHNYTALHDELIDTVLDFTARLPDPQCEVFLGHLGGVGGRVPVDATAYAQRDAEFVMNVHARWDAPSGDAACIGWARDLFAAAAPLATGGAYVNFLTEEEGDRVRAAYGPNYDRLVEVKNHYDPANVFRANQNIRPATVA